MSSFLEHSSDPSRPGVKLFERHPADVARALIGMIVTALFIRRRYVAAIQATEAPAMTGV